MNIKFRTADDVRELQNRGAGGLAAAKAENDFRLPGTAVTNAHPGFINGRTRVTDRTQDSSPIGIASVPAGLRQRALGNRARYCVRVA